MPAPQCWYENYKLDMFGEVINNFNMRDVAMRVIGKSLLSVFILIPSLYSSICIFKLFSTGNHPDKYIALIAGFITWLVPALITFNTVLGLNTMPNAKKTMLLVMMSIPYLFILSIIEHYS